MFLTGKKKFNSGKKSTLQRGPKMISVNESSSKTRANHRALTYCDHLMTRALAALWSGIASACVVWIQLVEISNPVSA
jgi:hypothetical protein